jgi:(p)ppGpp synthase/HD superfamily hydrolase
MPTLEDAIILAVQAHCGQKDKAGQPYFLHPLRVMLSMETETERMAAVLHDVVEDTGVTLEDLRTRGYPEEVIMAVEALTRRETETYDQFIERVGRNPMARKVKIADLQDNIDLGRLADPGPRDLARVDKYRRALEKLLEGEG